MIGSQRPVASINYREFFQQGFAASYALFLSPCSNDTRFITLSPTIVAIFNLYIHTCLTRTVVEKRSSVPGTYLVHAVTSKEFYDLGQLTFWGSFQSSSVDLEVLDGDK